jgi:hypothetical protein
VRFAEQQRRLVLCPRPIQGEQSSKQYAGIRALIEAHRAKPFSGEEYDRVLDWLIDRRTELLTTHAGIPFAQWPTVPAAARSNVPAELRTEGSPTDKAGTKRRPTGQGGFGFVDEIFSAKQQKIDRKRMESQILLLEQLWRDLADATRSDGGKLLNVQDVREWLRAKIASLRDNTNNS